MISTKLFGILQGHPVQLCLPLAAICQKCSIVSPTPLVYILSKLQQGQGDDFPPNISHNGFYTTRVCTNVLLSQVTCPGLFRTTNMGIVY